MTRSEPLTLTAGTLVARYAEIVRMLWKYHNVGLFKPHESLKTILQESMPEAAISDGKPEELVRDLEAMGPTFVKIGQSFSTRPDLISAEYVTALSSMQDHCSAIPFNEIRNVIEKEIGVRITKAFSHIEEKPLAVASLGQVHRGRLRDGRDVVIKVQKPGTEFRVNEDLSILTQIAEKVEDHSETGQQFGYSQWMSQLRRCITRELNYEIEASNLETMANYMEPYEDLIVPLPVWDFTSRRVITMDYIGGVKITNGHGIRQTEEDWSQLAIQLTHAYLDQFFIHGFVHADPHPGNILLTEDQKLAVLDLGMVTHLSPGMRNQMLSLITAIVNGAGDEAAERAIDMSERQHNFSRTAAVREISQLVSEFSTANCDHGEGMLMLQITRSLAEHGCRPPPEVILLGKTLLNLEHLISTLAPGLQLGELVQDHLSRVFRDRAFKRFNPSAMLSGAAEAGEFLQKVPRQLSSLLTQLADNSFTVRVDSIDENFFAENLQKIANRVSVGLIVAALIVAAAMLMRIETEATIWGYPAFAMVCFLIAGLLGLALVISVLWNDRKKKQ